MERGNKWILSGFLLLAACLILGMPQSAQAAKKTSINKSKISLNVSKKQTLTVRQASKKVTWKSTNKKVAVVKSTSGKKKQKAVILAKKKGTCIIVAKVGGKTMKCKVTVKSVKVETPAPASPVTAGAVGVYAKTVTATRSSISVQVGIYNGMEYSLSYGMGYHFEKYQQDKGWVSIETVNRMVPAIACILDSMSENTMDCTLEVPEATLSSGTYRVCLTDMSLKGVSESVTLHAPFVVTIP